MAQFKVVFTVTKYIHPFTEVVEAASVEEAKQIVTDLVISLEWSVNQIVAVIQQ